MIDQKPYKEINMQDPDRNTPIEIPLYRISDEVKNELFRALSFWNQFATNKNQIFIERAASDLKNPYATTKSILASTAATTNIKSDSFASIKINNGIIAFKKYLLDEKTKTLTSEQSKLLNDIIETFYLAIESVN